MQILIIGNGGREHAITWKVAQSPKVKQIFVAPGNAGTASEPKARNIDVDAANIDELLSFAQSHAIDLTIVGPEAPLAAGIVDEFQRAGLKIFGPTQQAAQLESSKDFSKAFMQRYHIPTARYRSFAEAAAAKTYLATQSFPIVLKADGLAAGKGVIIAQNLSQAEQAVDAMLTEHHFGLAGNKVIIEEFLSGEEASYIVMVDGEHILPLASSQDHKARDNGDRGPNTGGMGAYSPAPVVTPSLEQKILKDVITPVVKGMQQEGHPYTGFLYAGLMISDQGEAKVLEFNCRLGDPETQPLMLRLDSDLVELCLASIAVQLDKASIAWKPQAALGVVACADGYPSNYEKGYLIEGLEHQAPNEKIFYAGVKADNSGYKTHGGRVLCATALGENVTIAQKRAYQLLNKIHFSGINYRTDIGHRAIARESTRG